MEIIERNLQQQKQKQNEKQKPSTSQQYYHYQVTTGSLSKETKQTYTLMINWFLAYYKIKDIAPMREYSPKVIKQMVKDYVVYLRDVKKLSRSSIRLHLCAIAHFFYMVRDDDYKIDWTKVKKELPPDENIRKDRAYTMEEVQKILSVCSRLREKVIVLLLQSTGMRIGAVHTLKVGDLSPKQTNQGRIYKIEVYSGTSDCYYCYCNIESAQRIDEYLKERTDASEILINDSPLIRNLYNSLNIKIVKPLSHHTIKYTLDHIVKKSGIRKTFQFTGEAKRAKGFRKLYKSVAEDSGMKPINVELTHGHSIGISGHYYRPLESQVLEDYMTHAAAALTIDPRQRLEQENQELKKDYLAELGDLRQEFNEMKQMLVNLKKGTQKKLVKEFFQKTGDELQDEWWASDEAKL